MAVTGLPVAISPVTTQSVPVVVENSGALALGFVALDSTGTFTFTLSSGAFASSGVKGFSTFNMTYQLVS
jgi:hypothetical protein